MPDPATGRQCSLCRCWHYTNDLDLCPDCRRWEASHSGDLGDLLAVEIDQAAVTNR